MLFTENAANSSLHAGRIAAAVQRTDSEPDRELAKRPIDGGRGAVTIPT
jgi:hypothetical protein